MAEMLSSASNWPCVDQHSLLAVFTVSW